MNILKKLTLGLAMASVSGLAMAHGVNTDYEFLIDATQSSLTLTVVDGTTLVPTGASSSAAMASDGVFFLNLGGGPGNWNAAATMESILASAEISPSNPLSVFGNLGSGSIAIDFETIAFEDFDLADNAGTVLANGPAISNGVINTDVLMSAIGPAIVNGFLPATVDLTTFSSIVPWSIEVADDNSIGSTVPGNLEARLVATSYFEIIQGNPAGGLMRGDIVLVGSSTAAAVPVPAAVWLFGSGLIALFGIRRRQA